MISTVMLAYDFAMLNWVELAIYKTYLVLVIMLQLEHVEIAKARP